MPGRIRVIINDEFEYSMGTLGVGAETWASMLLVLSELVASTPKMKFPVMFLADEIGAGIHYSKLEEMWAFLLDFLSKYPHVQMVMTTHSHDCINAFCNIFQKESQDKAKIVRLHKSDAKGGIKPTEYSRDLFANILAGEWEVRG
jgi:AAA15 family ATPase/GTPase